VIAWPLIYLATAWNRAYGRNPDPSGAYRDAIRAVEASAKPIILPADPVATLGKMIAALGIGREVDQRGMT
jgi:hypothetical protein